MGWKHRRLYTARILPNLTASSSLQVLFVYLYQQANPQQAWQQWRWQATIAIAARIAAAAAAGISGDDSDRGVTVLVDSTPTTELSEAELRTPNRRDN